MNYLPSLRQLRYLAGLADEGHFGRAAEAMGITQSTLSAAIRELEEGLGATLVDRTSRRVVLTPLGREAVERARRILADVADLAASLRDKAAPLAGELHLGVIPTIGPYFLPRVLPRLRKQFPGLRLFLREDLTHRLVADLEAGKLDLALLALPCACGASETLPLFDDRFLVACRGDHPLAAAKRVDAARLARENLLLLEDGHCLRDQALSACRLQQPPPGAAAVAATSLLTLVQMADNGLGLTLVPEIAVKAGLLSGTDLVTRPLDERGAKRTIGLAWRRGSRRADEFRTFGQALGQFGGGQIATPGAG